MDEATTPSRNIADQIALTLGETDEGPRAQIRRALRILGPERLEPLVAEALATEQRGGLWLPDQSRRRTLGGIFFYLLRQHVTTKERARIFLPAPRPQPATGEEASALASPLPWSAELVATVLAQSGKATTMKLTVVGRPLQVVDRGAVVIVGLQAERIPALPKGVPAPTGEPTRCALLIGRRQWNQVEAALRDPEDRLIAEGYPSLAAGLEGITVHVTRATTVKSQSAKRPANAPTPEAPTSPDQPSE